MCHRGDERGKERVTRRPTEPMESFQAVQMLLLRTMGNNINNSSNVAGCPRQNNSHNASSTSKTLDSAKGETGFASRFDQWNAPLHYSLRLCGRGLEKDWCRNKGGRRRKLRLRLRGRRWRWRGEGGRKKLKPNLRELQKEIRR